LKVICTNFQKCRGHPVCLLENSLLALEHAVILCGAGGVSSRVDIPGAVYPMKDRRRLENKYLCSSSLRKEGQFRSVF
jgi:hypothetical protein